MLIVDKMNKIIEISEVEYLNGIKYDLKHLTKDLKIRTNLKIIIVGEGGVGKTSLIQRYLGRPFHAQYLITLGVQTSVISVDLEPLIGIKKSINLQLWDLAGQPQYRDVVRPFFIQTDEAIAVGDLSRLLTFERIIDWITETNKHNMKKTPFLIIGSKYDLVENIETLKDTKIRNYLQKINNLFSDDYNEFLFVETSSKMALNINEVFEIVLLKNILLSNS